MFYIILFFATLIPLLVFMGIGLTMDTETERRFQIKKLIDCLVYIFAYATFTSAMSVMHVQEIWLKVVFAIVPLLSLIRAAYVAGNQLGSMRSPRYQRYRRLKNSSFLLMALSWTVCLLLSISAIYYALFFINPDWYVIAEDTRFLPFEFIYFTFTVSITFGGSEMQAVGLLPKAVQIVHILSFYFVLGSILFEVFRSKKEIEK